MFVMCSVIAFRRTWSFSTIEFLKYRRLNPMLTSEDGQFTDDLSVPTTSWYDDEVSINEQFLSEVKHPINTIQNNGKVVIVKNISPHVTRKQLISFFSKFGKVVSCQVDSDGRWQSLHESNPVCNIISSVAEIEFKQVEDAQKALLASDEELKFYNRIMLVSTVDGRSDFDSFPINVLTRIIYYLSPLDRIRVERVNKTFLKAAAKAWAIDDSLSFANQVAFNQFFNAKNPMRNTHLQALLKRCGIYLRSLDLSGTRHLLNGNAFTIISSLCPHLHEVNISGLTADSKTLRAFSEALPQLSSVTYANMVSVGDKAIWSMFIQNGVNIRKIDLRGCKLLKGYCLKSFSAKLEHVLLDGCSRLERLCLEDLCLRSPNVKELRLNGCFRISDENINSITRCMSNLEKFSLCGDNFTMITSSGLVALSQLTNLSELMLDHNSAVSNELLEALFVPSSRLRKLSIAYAGCSVALTESSLTRIGKLQFLEDVDLSALTAVTNAVVSEIGSKCLAVRKLKLCGCTCLEDQGVCSLKNLRKLELLDITGCIMVTNLGVQPLLDCFPATENDLRQVQIALKVANSAKALLQFT
ncbi:unnamed protein product [Enterobius vermicularis]|uniref:RRM domain-containing protein n=1 Tax=Enterobius vermicularis TaxID=51028 RepID=A0A0N4UYS3_ENTVE|nr:unnamed protein product [Enterobius vermicularis]